MSNIFPVIVCIAKNEHSYIEEFVKYHLAVGFKHIYLYDNQDIPDTYNNILEKYHKTINIIHIPGNYYKSPVQYIALNHFINEIIKTNNHITHVAHFDIDEYLVLKKHSNVTDFIKDYIKDNCSAIAINWRFFGSSGHTKPSNEPITSKYTKCEKAGNLHVKVICDAKSLIWYNTPHDVILKYGITKLTTGEQIIGPFNKNPNFDVAQINHYKCKTLEEYKKIRIRGRADVLIKDQPTYDIEEIEKDFKLYDLNEIEDLTAKQFYENIK